MQVIVFTPHSQLTAAMILTPFSELLIDLGWELLSVGPLVSESHFADKCVSSFTSDIIHVGARLLNSPEQDFLFPPQSLPLVKQTQ